MPRDIKQLNVFISSPSSLHTERTLIAHAIDDLSSDLEADRAIQLVVLRWETDVVPAPGRPQSVVSNQVAPKCDIYVGLMGAHFGSPTGRYDSGTEEEYREALARFEREPTSIRVLFYFKTSLDDVFNLDLAQFQKAKAFHEALQGKAFNGTFATQDELVKVVKRHLRKLVTEQWDGQQWKSLAEEASSPPSESPQDPSCGAAVFGDTEAEVIGGEDIGGLGPEPSGFLELISVGLDAAEQMGQIMASMIDAAVNFQEALAARGPDLEVARRVKSNAQQIRIYNSISDDMTGFAANFRTNTAKLSAVLSLTLDSFTGLRKVVLEEMPALQTDLTAAFVSFTKLTLTVRQSRDVMVSLQKNVKGIPPLTGKLRQARTALLRAVDSYVADITVFLSRAETL